MITVDNPFERIFAIWKKAMEVEVGKNLSSDPNVSVAKFPYATLTYLGAQHNMGTTDGSEVAVTVSVQTDCYTSGTMSQSKVWALDDVSHKAMAGMGFRRSSQTLTSTDSSSIKRVTCRYSRVYTGQLLGE